jgi:anti-sigma factor (TIGR02949 family)
MQCAESLRLQAYFDAELDAVSANEIERHMEHCGECRALLDSLQQLRVSLRQDVKVERAPAELRERLMQALDDEEASVARIRQPPPVRRRLASFWGGAASGFGGAALAAAVGMYFVIPAGADPLQADLVSAHVRSLMPDHLIDVVSTDRHTVKPWFSGHADVSPLVADFDAQGYRLVGGRADYLNRQRAAVVVYEHGKHTINVFSWASDSRALNENDTRNGYHLAFWKIGNLQYCAVSDTGWDELKGLKSLLKDLSSREDAQQTARE